MSMLRQGQKGLRFKGHKLTIQFSGERTRAERSSTGYCTCGWSESASVQSEVRNEYRFHLEDVAKKMGCTKPETPSA